MFARNVSIRLKPNTLNDFNQTFEKEVVPMLRRQAGFRDEITLSGDDNTHVTAMSLWDSQEQAEAYNTNAYPSVLKIMDKFLDGAPKVRVWSVINSTPHKRTREFLMEPMSVADDDLAAELSQDADTREIPLEHTKREKPIAATENDLGGELPQHASGEIHEQDCCKGSGAA